MDDYLLHVSKQAINIDFSIDECDAASSGHVYHAFCLYVWKYQCYMRPTHDNLVNVIKYFLITAVTLYRFLFNSLVINNVNLIVLSSRKYKDIYDLWPMQGFVSDIFHYFRSRSIFSEMLFIFIFQVFVYISMKWTKQHFI